MDEVFIRIQRVQHYLWRVVDQDGVVLDILVQPRRDANAAYQRCPLNRGIPTPAASVTSPGKSHLLAKPCYAILLERNEASIQLLADCVRPVNVIPGRA